MLDRRFRGVGYSASGFTSARTYISANLPDLMGSNQRRVTDPGA